MNRSISTFTTKPGDRIRFDGGVWEVYRVSIAGAWIRTTSTRTVTVYDARAREERTFEARERKSTIISAHASVERVQGGTE